ncbi:hypothetical protein H0H81_000319 [Sphagnurus paluster]|uniref:Uncharacterized protein n=1 Tax=Sphagnurus paluster TaxID=117069 RepID=A0A9P7KIY0_9AGAR|nr:hypothetical protein H0H81_000319 [Sphagnurus paluster]
MTPRPNFFQKPPAALIPSLPNATIPPPKDFSFAKPTPPQEAGHPTTPAGLCTEIIKLIEGMSPLQLRVTTGALFGALFKEFAKNDQLYLTNLVKNHLPPPTALTGFPHPTPPPPPTMEVDSPTTSTAPGPPGATPPARGNHTPPAPSSATRAPKHAPPPPPLQPAPKLTYAAALGSKPPRPRKAHPPTKLVAPTTTKWVAIPTNKSQLRDPAKHPSPLHIVGAINRELAACADEVIRGVHIANLGDSHILAATWTVGCNLLLTAAKSRDHHGLANPAYSMIIANALATIPEFSLQGASIIPYQLASRLQIKGLPTWDPSTNKPVELTSVFNTLNGLGIFEGVELITNSPAPSDALSWAWDPKTFNAESRPCAITVRFYNNNGRETGSLLKKAFYLLGHRRYFNKWQPRPPPPKKG